MERLFQWIPKMPARIETGVLLLFVLASAAAAVGTARLEVDFDALKMMGNRLPHMQDQVRIGQSKIAVGEFMNLVVSLPEGSYRDPETILRLQTLERKLSGIAGVTKLSSVTGVLKEVNSLLHRRAEEFSGLPDNTVSLGALMRLMNGLLPGEKQNWIDSSDSHARILVQIADFSSRKIEEIIRLAESSAQEVFPENKGVFFSGSTYMVARMNQYITRGLVRSVAVSMFIIFVIMALLFGSVRWGLVAMIPNVFPVLVAGGILGFAGIPLEFVTMTVAPIILGLAVDDTIHFMSFLKQDFRITGHFPTSLRRSYEAVGAAITETTLILCVTFLVFLSSRINSIRYMGILTASGMTAAYFADILITPILARRLMRPALRY
jgi:predicted RND superfamily exporter protein